MAVQKKRKKKTYFHKYINGTKGVISLMLAILMVPFVTLAGVLIDAARVRSTIAIFDEALCNASNSTLGTYEEFLKKRFGLLAMAQSSGDGSYDAQTLINETFNRYMQENINSLNKAFNSYTASAIGVYPLSEKEVLRTEILEYSKYTVPTKLLINGLSIDSIINTLTKSLKTTTNILDALTSSVNSADKLNECEDKFITAISTANSCEQALENATNAYTAFSDSVSEYNSLVTEMLEARRAAEAELRSAQSHQRSCQEEYDQKEAAVSDVLDQIQTLENETDSENNRVDNSEQIAAIREENKEGLDEYEQASDELEQAKKNTSGASSNLNSVNSGYASRLSVQREIVRENRDSYADYLDILADKLEETGDSVKEAQDAMAAAEKAGSEATQQIMKTTFSIATEVKSDTIKEMKDSKQEAMERGDSEAVYLWSDEIQNATDEKTITGDVGKVLTSDTEATTDEFTRVDYQANFLEKSEEVRDLKNAVEAYAIATGDSYMSSTTSYKLNIEMPIDDEGLQDIQNELAEKVLGNPFLEMLKAIIGFIKSLTNLSLFYNGKLNATVDINNIRIHTIGGNADDVLASDKVLSERYKAFYGSVSGSTDGEQAIALDGAIDELINIVDELSNIISEFGANPLSVFKFLFTLGKYIPRIVTQIKIFIDNIGRIGEVAYGRLLLAGYVGYNTANRTNYDKSGLTGEPFTTAQESSKSTELFCGAETEYILTGNNDEIKSQQQVFHMIYQLRLMMNLPFVFTNQEVASIASAAGSASFGIGAAIVYLMYIFLEPLVDSFLLVNKGSVPIFKVTLYLSPSGFNKLIGSVISLDLTEDKKNTMTKGCIDFMSAGSVSSNFSQRYADLIQSGIGKGSKLTGVLDAVNMTYTKIMIMLLLLRPTDRTLERLADVIQMEATYGVGGDSSESADVSFSLNNSYTYVRAMGELSGAYLFSPDKAPWISNEQHIVYRGY